MNSKTKFSIIENTILIALLGCLLLSGYYFIYVLDLSIGQWLMFNACSIAIITQLFCYLIFKLTHNSFLKAIPLLPMYYYGTMGLFLMPWILDNIFAHITHIVITISMIWNLSIYLKNKESEALSKGLLLGILIFVPVFAFIHVYSQSHLNEFIEALQLI